MTEMTDRKKARKWLVALERKHPGTMQRALDGIMEARSEQAIQVLAGQHLNGIENVENVLGMLDKAEAMAHEVIKRAAKPDEPEVESSIILTGVKP